MPYSTEAMVEFWGQMGEHNAPTFPSNWDYHTAMTLLIGAADGQINEHLRVPRGFYEAGGIAIQDELHDGKALPSGSKKPLVPRYTPILSVSKLEYYENSAWTTKTEGIDNDYIVSDECIYLIDWPDTTTYRNIRLSYRAGYDLSPENVGTVSAMLAAATAHLLIDAADRQPTSVAGFSSSPAMIASLTRAAFSPDLKAMLDRYRLEQVRVTRG